MCVVDVLEAPGVRVGDADELIERVVQRRRGVPPLVGLSLSARPTAPSATRYPIVLREELELLPAELA